MKLKTPALYCLLMTILLSACNAVKPQQTTSTEVKATNENLTVSACGIQDPLNNIEWLKEKAATQSDNIALYKSEYTQENYFAFSHPNRMGYTSLTFYDCAGNEIFHWNTATPPGNARYEKFFGDKVFVADLRKGKK